MGEVVDIRQGIASVYDASQLAIFPRELDSFMQGFGREATLGKVATDPKYWEQRIEYARDRLRAVEVGRKSVAIIASDALTFIEQEPEKFAELPAGQQTILNELAGRIITEE